MEILGGVLGLVLVVLAVVLALFWLIFPWMVHSQLKDLIELQKRQESKLDTMNGLLERIERNSRKTVDGQTAQDA